jgi:hypothetical protein
MDSIDPGDGWVRVRVRVGKRRPLMNREINRKRGDLLLNGKSQQISRIIITIRKRIYRSKNPPPNDRPKRAAKKKSRWLVFFHTDHRQVVVQAHCLYIQRKDHKKRPRSIDRSKASSEDDARCARWRWAMRRMPRRDRHRRAR